MTLKVLPVGELFTFGKEDDLVDRAAHFVLPAMILGLANAALLMRYTRASMLEVLDGDYITTARAKGLASRVVLVRHGLRNALIPIITVLAFLLPELIAGAVITETVFNWPGLGQLSVRAARDRDPALMMGVVLIVGTSRSSPASSRTSPTPSPTRGSGMSAVADGVPRQVVAGQHESLRRRGPAVPAPSPGDRRASSILTTIVAIAVFLPLLVPLDPLKTDYGAIRQPPGPGHPLGADLSGRDIFARVVHGTRVSLVVGFGAVAVYSSSGRRSG